ncbi:unnamed protein product [Allacma fusca]|uniref:Uncharacterized protein n=1 Tax=Allacma fusca TaxID=39272 RepID=A0A8J2KSF8_9HEXA|nr:unnamed protein product [Allacma fusca]
MEVRTNEYSGRNLRRKRNAMVRLKLAKFKGFCKNGRQDQFWQILCSLPDTDTNSFLIGLYEGASKPSRAYAFLRRFVQELAELISTGVTFREVNYQLSVNCICCDAPARAFVTTIKNHNAYYGCGKCSTSGTYVDKKLVFLDSEAAKRTDESFRNKEKKEHHTGTYEEAKPKVPHFEQFSELSDMESHPEKPIQRSRAGRTYINNTHFGHTAGLSRRRHDSNGEASNIEKKFIVCPIDPSLFENDVTNVNHQDELPYNQQHPIAEESNNRDILFSDGNNREFNNQISIKFLEHFEVFKKEVFTKLAVIESNQNTMQSATFSLVNNARVNNLNLFARSPPNDEYEFNFPFRTMREFRQFDARIKAEPEFKKALFAYLDSIRGSDLTVAVYDILKEVLAFELAYRFIYTGVRGKQNVSLLNINDIIFGV